MRSWFPTPTLRDALVAAAVGVLVFGGSIAVGLDGSSGNARPLVPGGFALLLLACAPLLWRSRYPVAVGLISVPASTVYYPLNYPDGPVMIAGAIALYAIVRRGHRWVGWPLGLGQWAYVHATEVMAFGTPLPGQALGVLAWVLVLLIGAEVARKRQEYLAVLRERAEEAERTREEEARRRAADERVRLAREVHDTIAHNISLINVQAGTALYLMDSEPERAAEALATIKRTSKETLAELRGTLNMLRRVDEQAPRTPIPTLDRVEELARGTRATGIEVRLDVRGDQRRLPTKVEAAGYRIVQEALTNAVRHADASVVEVRLGYGDRWLEVVVDDDGHGAPKGFTPGNGVAGMRERAAALGGELDATTAPGAGFHVRAWLPVFDNGGERTSEGATT